jgi:hypothetical protein
VKHVIGVNLALIVGILLGFFGVFASVFSDGALKERLIVIAVILLIYYLLSGVWGYLLPDYSWKWGLFIGIPGVLFLGFFMLREFNAYYLIYMVLIIYIACTGARGGSSLRNHRENSLAGKTKPPNQRS